MSQPLAIELNPAKAIFELGQCIAQIFTPIVLFRAQICREKALEKK
jgi:hypothetical protein